MTSSTETQTALTDAEKRAETTEAALAKVVAVLDPSNRTSTAAEIKDARSKYDDLLTERNEASIALELASTTHAAAIKSEKLSRLAALRSGAAEGRGLVEKQAGKLAKTRATLAEQCNAIDVLLHTHAQQCSDERQLCAELGETSETREITRTMARALALPIVSKAEGSHYPTAAIADWLTTAPSQGIAPAIWRLFYPSQPPPNGMTLEESVEILIRTGDVSAPAIEAARRIEERDRPQREYTERVAAARAHLKYGEGPIFDAMLGVEPEERLKKIYAERAKRQAEAERLASLGLSNTSGMGAA